MTLHLSYEIIFHVGGLKLAVIDIASSRLKVIQFSPDNHDIVFYVSTTCPLEHWTSQKKSLILSLHTKPMLKGPNYRLIHLILGRILVLQLLWMTFLSSKSKTKNISLAVLFDSDFSNR